MSEVKKVVLAYSGGLDTSIIIPWLKEHYNNCEVIAVCGNVGQKGELEGLEERAKASGASKLYIEDLTDEFVEDYVIPTMQAGADYEGYLLGTSFARPCIAKALADIAIKEGADAICHGCTGKGNDQVRFELTLKALCPDMAIIAPWREWELRSRDQEIDYAAAHNIPIPVSHDHDYSMDRNMWHLSHEGDDLENPANAPHKDMYLVTCDPEEAPDKPEIVTIDFEKGIPTAVNGKKMDGVELVNTLNAIGARNGIGIDDLVENRLVGMKSRGVYENPCGSILFYAHTELERLCLDRATFHFKEIAAVKYSELVYDGMWFAPLREALQAFADKTSETVTGKVTLRLYKGNIMSNGAESPYSLYNEEFVTFGEDDVYNQADAEGFINLFGLPLTIRALMKEKNAK